MRYAINDLDLYYTLTASIMSSLGVLSRPVPLCSPRKAGSCNARVFFRRLASSKRSGCCRSRAAAAGYSGLIMTRRRQRSTWPWDAIQAKSGSLWNAPGC